MNNEVLQSIALVMGIVAYAAMTFMAAFAFFRLRNQSNDLLVLKVELFNVYSMLSATQVKEQFAEVEKLRNLLPRLVKREKFDEAAKVKEHIEQQEKAAMEALKRFNETFGENAEINVTKISL